MWRGSWVIAVLCWTALQLGCNSRERKLEHPPELRQPDEGVPTGSVQNQSLEDSQSLVQSWLNRLKHAKYAHVLLRSERIVSRVPLENAEDGETVEAHVIVQAQAVMNPDKHWMVAWDNDKAQGRKEDDPALVISYEDGQVTEKLWYPAFQQYRTNRYPATSASGATDTQYVHGCQIGTLLQTWLGESETLDMFSRGFALAVVEPELVDINGEQCVAFNLDWEPDVDPMKQPGRPKTTATYYLNGSGYLKRWTTTSWVRDGAFLRRMFQSRDYTFDFSEPAPAERGMQREFSN